VNKTDAIIVTSLLRCSHRNKQKQKAINNMQIKTNRKSGFTLVEIMIVVAIIGLLAAIAIPNFVKAREQAQLNSIVNNLRITEGAKDQWALENKQGTGALPVASDIAPYMKNNNFPPTLIVGEAYNINAVGTPATAGVTVKLGTYPNPGTITLP
jgi:prepilin-type N-terminal cleavage/methylation domain-containing protein